MPRRATKTDTATAEAVHITSTGKNQCSGLLPAVALRREHRLAKSPMGFHPTAVPAERGALLVDVTANDVNLGGQ